MKPLMADCRRKAILQHAHSRCDGLRAVGYWGAHANQNYPNPKATPATPFRDALERIKLSAMAQEKLRDERVN